jgi:hypothetical protein
MIRRIGRAIFAVLIGLSVATLPATGGFTVGATKTTERSVANAASDCDHHHKAPSGDTQKTAEDSACMAGCALNCFNFVAPGIAGIALSSPVGATLKPIRMTSGAPSSMGSPPFRPPRS